MGQSAIAFTSVDPLHQAVKMYLVGAIQFGTITIRYQHGQPTHVEKNEIFRLGGGEEPGARQ